jgi:hypothetical protein
MDHGHAKHGTVVAERDEYAAENRRLREALELMPALIVTARQYFPKSIRNADKFQLELACAALGKAQSGGAA